MWYVDLQLILHLFINNDDHNDIVTFVSFKFPGMDDDKLFSAFFMGGDGYSACMTRIQVWKLRVFILCDLR